MKSLVKQRHSSVRPGDIVVVRSLTPFRRKLSNLPRSIDCQRYMPQQNKWEQPMKFDFVINLKAAQQIGLIIPPNVLVRATSVIK
jgi:hypothetical protein